MLEQACWREGCGVDQQVFVCRRNRGVCVMNWGLGEGTRMITGVNMCRHASVQDAASVGDRGEHRAEAAPHSCISTPPTSWSACFS